MSLIVIIEDNPESARLAGKVLKIAGFDIAFAEDGEQGLLAVMAQSPDLVLVDLGLPDMDGQTVVALMRQQPSLAGKPIIAFTAWPHDTALEMAHAYGCDGVITKPIDTRAFANQVRQFLPET